MKKILYPSMTGPKPWLQRPALDNSALLDKVRTVMQAVQLEGDQAVLSYTEQFDGVRLRDNRVSAAEFDAAENLLDAELKSSIQQAAGNIRRFHEKQLQPVEVIETMPGIRCWRKSVGIEKVGLYIPGGTAPLFSTILMLAIPAALAGCREIVLCSPPGKDGALHPAILYAAKLTGVTRVFKIGGVQAIAAMTYGTATVPAVYKIFGPGNQYVTAAKQLAQQQGLAIDMPAGPSEVCVVADATADPAFVAADLLSQAEHGADSQVLLITDSELRIAEIEHELLLQLAKLPRKELAEKALGNSTLVLVNNLQEAVTIVNEYAPEHLILSCENAETVAAQIINAGSVFIGPYSPESVGDYASGTNHTLPTNGYARAYSGVSVDAFVKKITYQQLSREGLNAIGNTVIRMAEAEGLQAHANAVAVRLSK
jgi:histidinol dehydrogenase